MLHLKSNDLCDQATAGGQAHTLAEKPCGGAALSLASRMLPPHRSPCTMPACNT